MHNDGLGLGGGERVGGTSRGGGHIMHNDGLHSRQCCWCGEGSSFSCGS